MESEKKDPRKESSNDLYLTCKVCRCVRVDEDRMILPCGNLICAIHSGIPLGNGQFRCYVCSGIHKHSEVKFPNCIYYCKLREKYTKKDPEPRNETLERFLKQWRELFDKYIDLDEMERLSKLSS